MTPTKEQVNAAYNEGKRRGMTGLPSDFRAVLTASLSSEGEQISGEAWRLVPNEATQAMVDARNAAYAPSHQIKPSWVKQDWSAMIEAAHTKVPGGPIKEKVFTEHDDLIDRLVNWAEADTRIGPDLAQDLKDASRLIQSLASISPSEQISGEDEARNWWYDKWKDADSQLRELRKAAEGEQISGARAAAEVEPIAYIFFKANGDPEPELVLHSEYLVPEIMAGLGARALYYAHTTREQISGEAVERGALAICNVERKHISLEPLSSIDEILPADRSYIMEEARACLEAAIGAKP